MTWKHRSAWAGIAALLVAPGAGIVSAKPTFERYQVILDRKPFGEVVVQEKEEKPVPAAARPSFAKTLKVCAITQSELGIRVGLVDIQEKPPESFFLWVGESYAGIELVDADYEAAGALLRQGSQQEWIYMDEKQGPTRAAASAPSSSASAARRRTYAERLRQRREAMKKRVETAQPSKLSGEELKQHLKEYQMNLIRAKGELGPPLPIPLTPEMDAQLVKEGVLPPLEEEE